MKVRIFIMVLCTTGYLQVLGQVPTVTSFTPTSGPVGTAVTITGTNFDPIAAGNTVFFGAVTATVTNATAIQLVVNVPLGATYEPITVLSNGKTAFSALPFLVTFSGGGGINTSSMGTSVTYSSGNNPYHILVKDLDGDGKGDVVATNRGDNAISVYRNTATPGVIGAGTLATGVTFATGAYPQGVASGDLDGDGKPEIVTANASANTISVFRNTSSAGSITISSFSAKIDFNTGNFPIAVAIADLDKDGKPDLAVANANSNTISVFRNTSSVGSLNSGSFASKVDYNTSSSPISIAVGDLDGDGRVDMIAANSISNSVSVLRNTSSPGAINSGSFASRIDFTSSDNPYVVASGDLDGDQKLDLAIATYSGNAISLLRNTSTIGTISFSSNVDLLTSLGCYWVSIADLDGDGKPEIIGTTDNANNVSIFRNVAVPGSLSTASFQSRVDFSNSYFALGVAIGDMDADEKPDLVTTNFGTTSISIIHNTVLAPEPTGQPPGPIIFSKVTSTALNASWAETNPTPSGYLAIFSANAAPNFVPVDGIPYALDQPVGSVSGNIMYVEQNGSEPGFGLSSLTLGETIHVVVYAFNGSGPTINYLTTSPLTGSKAPVADTTPPTVASNATPATVPPNTDLLVSANFADLGSGVDYGQLQYRPIDGAAPNNFQTVAMTNATGATWSYTIPANEITELGIEYKFLITDFEPNDNSAAQTTFRTRVRHSDGLHIPYTSPGRDVSNYRILSVPLVLDDMTADNVFGSWVDHYDPANWTLYRWNGSIFAELNGNTQIEVGKGYWFLTWESAGTDMNTGPGTTVDVSVSNPFQMVLAPGWTQIGNPYNFNISWSDILAANPTKVSSLGANSKIRVFRGTVSDVDQLNRFEGGFVKNISTSNVTIDIPVEKDLSINSRKAVAAPLINALDQPSWEVRFSLHQGDSEFNLGGLGMRPEASDDFDEYDDYNLPHFLEYLEVRFPKKRVGMTYAKDIVNATNSFVWNFFVESNQDGEISLQWDNSYFGDTKEIMLLDVARHQAVDMRTESQYNFPATASREFRVIYGDPEFVKKELLPDRPVLYQPYPNPFTQQVHIDYGLPQESNIPADASIMIYNVLGERVSVVTVPNRPGNGTWTWGAEGVSSGIYFVRLCVGDVQMTQKLIKQ